MRIWVKARAGIGKTGVINGMRGFNRLTPMTKTLTIVIAVGLAIGIVGGLYFGESWVSIGGLVVGAGVTVFYAIGILKNPFDVVRGMADMDNTISDSVSNESKSAHQQTATMQVTQHSPPNKVPRSN